MSSTDNSFYTYTETFKKYDETKRYNDYDNRIIEFNSDTVELSVIEDVDVIISEMNKISKQMFYYGMVFESQSRVLQSLEDEFELWKSQKSSELSGTQFKSEAAKEKHIMSEHSGEYMAFTESLNREKYKLGILKRTIDSIDCYSYKLHSILSYKQKILDKTL